MIEIAQRFGVQQDQHSKPECHAEHQVGLCWTKVTITRFYDFDDNKIYVVICTNQVQVFKYISEF